MPSAVAKPVQRPVFCDPEKDDATPEVSGLASGAANTAMMIGGVLGLAILASVSATCSRTLLASGSTLSVALASGYRLALLLAAAFAAAAALISVVFVRARSETTSSRQASPRDARPAAH
jgi:hypothetical protein